MKAILALFAIIAVVAAYPVKDCSGGPVPCKHVSLDLNAQPTKGSPIGMDWKLTCGQHEFLNNVLIYVAFNGFSFHEEDVAQSIEVAGGSQTDVKYNVEIPSFAPSVKSILTFLL